MTPRQMKFAEWGPVVAMILAIALVLILAIDAQGQAGEGPAKTPKGGDPSSLSNPYAGTGGEKPATCPRSSNGRTQPGCRPDQLARTEMRVRPPLGEDSRRVDQRVREQEGASPSPTPAHNGVAPENATPAPVLKSRSEIHTGAGVALLLARVCRLEADWRLTDCTAIYHIGRKRFGEFWLPGLLEYSKLYRRTQPRARRISQAPWGPIPGAGKRENARWERLRLHALELVSGKHRDPCREAVHWGGRMDVPHPKQIPAKCAAQGHTANTLYRVK